MGPQTRLRLFVALACTTGFVVAGLLATHQSSAVLGDEGLFLLVLLSGWSRVRRRQVGFPSGGKVSTTCAWRSRTAPSAPRTRVSLALLIAERRDLSLWRPSTSRAQETRWSVVPRKSRISIGLTAMVDISRLLESRA